MTKKLMLGVVLPVGIMIVLVLLRVSVPLKWIIGLCLVQFLGDLVIYPWLWKPRGFTLGRLTLVALSVSGLTAAVLVISSWASKLGLGG